LARVVAWTKFASRHQREHVEKLIQLLGLHRQLEEKDDAIDEN
jgi:hypothetical protein